MKVKLTCQWLFLRTLFQKYLIIKILSEIVNATNKFWNIHLLYFVMFAPETGQLTMKKRRGKNKNNKNKNTSYVKFNES